MANTSSNMTETRPHRLFLRYLLPSLLGMMLMSTNILIDGLFVSHGIGEEAFAGVNIALPIYSVILSISLWIGMGGAALFSIAIGRKDLNQAKKIYTDSILLSLVITGLIIALCLIFEEPLAYLFGANDELIHHVLDYLHIILVFGLIYVIENILSIFIRNDGNPILAMVALIATSVLNIFFNYIFIFIFHWGVKGAAYATVLATVLGTLILLLHFTSNRNNLSLVYQRLNFLIINKSSILAFLALPWRALPLL